MKKEERINTISEMSGTASGAAVGAVIGSTVAGPVGAIGGAVTGNIVERIFSWAGNEISNRLLSKQEEKRITNVMDLAKEKIENNFADNKKLRDDHFLIRLMIDQRQKKFWKVLYLLHKKSMRKENYHILLICMPILHLIKMSVEKWRIH